MSRWVTWIAVGLFILLGRAIVQQRIAGRNVLFALLNLAAVYLLYFWSRDARFVTLFTLFFFAYVAMVSVQYLAMRWWVNGAGAKPWLAFFVPIVFLAVIRYAPITELAPLISQPVHDVLIRHPEFTPVWVFIGMSYVAFRTSYLVLEVRNDVVPRPNYWQYLGFAFFMPTLSVGPISPYAMHHRAFTDDQRPSIPLGRATLRILVGAVKFFFFGPLLNTLTYSGLLLDSHPHIWIDLPIAAVAYYLFLFCNFSGFCDMAIGGAGLMGIEVAENFNGPLMARNMRDFWNRWHITLSQYMRDVVFSPLSKVMARKLSPAHAVAVPIFVVFLLIGIWHGTGWNYALFGVIHGVGVVVVHYYTIALKKRLGKEGFAAYNKNPFIHAAAVVLTFAFVTASLFVFANDGTAMKDIFEMLRRSGASG